MDRDEAHGLIQAHDAYAVAVTRQTRAALAVLYRRELAARGMTLLYGGPASKDELVNAVVDLRFPLARMNEARQVWYAAEVTS